MANYHCIAITASPAPADEFLPLPVAIDTLRREDFLGYPQVQAVFNADQMHAYVLADRAARQPVAEVELEAARTEGWNAALAAFELHEKQRDAETERTVDCPECGVGFRHALGCTVAQKLRQQDAQRNAALAAIERFTIPHITSRGEKFYLCSDIDNQPVGSTESSITFTG